MGFRIIPNRISAMGGERIQVHLFYTSDFGPGFPGGVPNVAREKEIDVRGFGVECDLKMNVVSYSAIAKVEDIPR